MRIRESQILKFWTVLFLSVCIIIFIFQAHRSTSDLVIQLSDISSLIRSITQEKSIIGDLAVYGPNPTTTWVWNL